MKTDTHRPFRPLSRLLLLPLSAAATSFLPACATDGVQERVDRRNDWIEQMGENAEIRQEARDERYQRQFDRLMN